MVNQSAGGVVEYGIVKRRSDIPFLRVGRALLVSLAAHGLALAALRSGPPVDKQSEVLRVDLQVAWAQEEAIHLSELMPPPEPEWLPLPLVAIPPDDPPDIAPPLVHADALEVAEVVDEQPEAVVPSPYWDGVRRELIRALRWPTGWPTETNVSVRLYALESGLLPLEPPPNAEHPIHAAVRMAVERAVRRAPVPPDEVVGCDMQLTVRFEPKP